MIRTVAASALVLAPALAAAGAETFSKDVAPILNRRCVACHRPGEIAPMSLMSYEEVRPFARAIADVVADGTMPPWHADPNHGHFANDRSLTEAEKNTILSWVRTGAMRGDPADLPSAPDFPGGWMVGLPDVTFKMAEPVEVPAEGVVDYLYQEVPTHFTEDKWIVSAEIRPGNREVVHHVIVFVLPPEEGKGGRGEERAAFGRSCPEARLTPRLEQLMKERIEKGLEPRDFGTFLSGWAPGHIDYPLPEGAAIRIEAGSRLLFQLHYTPSGVDAVDSETKIGLTFAEGPVTHTVSTVPIMNHQIAIPPRDPDYQATSCYSLARDVSLLFLTPHMHVRGKDFLYNVSFPDGRVETLLSVPRYDFNWQTVYALAEPLDLPTGSRIDCVAHFDNSVGNRANPDPDSEVLWGDQTWEEMMIGWVTFMSEREATTNGSP